MGIQRNGLIAACAASAGIHVALAPRHFAEGMGAGVGFAAAAVVLALFAGVLTWAPPNKPVLVGAAVVLAGLLVSYVLATTSGLPLLHPEPEPVDGLALATKAIEGLGLVAALALVRQPKGRLT